MYDSYLCYHIDGIAWKKGFRHKSLSSRGYFRHEVASARRTERRSSDNARKLEMGKEIEVAKKI